jgi:hypothetical protein
MNVRDPATVESLFAPLDFDWLKLWEEYGSEENPTLPQTRYPYKVLFLIDCTKKTDDLVAWAAAVETIATAGKGLVEAYEICNEPNRSRWLDWGAPSATPPDPGLYVNMLEIAYERIKAADPAAIVVSAGLAPVGRIQGTCNGWSGNDCNAMDEREYARQMFLLGAGDSFDAFGYHPYGFAYEPERALDELPPEDNGNGFAFRGVEAMHDLLEQHDLGDKPVWATEFSWLRDPNDDGAVPGWCHRRPEYENNVGWMDVPELQQAAYFTRAFQYADENWPWMGPMVVWNLDWHDYGWLCDPARYFSVLKVDYAEYTPLVGPGEVGEALERCSGRPDLTGVLVPTDRKSPWAAGSFRAPGTFRRGVVDVECAGTMSFGDTSAIPYTITLAYEALAGMEKRPAGWGPRLTVVPAALSFLADVDEPGLHTGVVVPLNTGFGALTWTATVSEGMQVTPALAITTGLQGMPLTVTVDSTGYSTGTFTGIITVTGTTTGVRDASQAVPVTLYVVPEVYRVYLPVGLRAG